MTDKNDALFLVRLPFGQKTIPYEEVPELIAMAKSPGYDGEHEAVMLALDVCHEEGLLRAAVQAGEVEVLDKSLHRMTQPFNGRLKDTVLTVQALREYVESIKGFLEVEDAPQAASAAKSGTGERSISKGEVINAFEPIHFDRNGWNNALSDVPKWIEPCRVTLGRRGDNITPATWNPVLIAAALLDKGITAKQLDAVFVRLKDWADEWREVSANDR